MKIDERAYVLGVVDDDKRVLQSLGDLLESAGFCVRLFESGVAFLQADGMNGIDVLLCDIRMPGVNGVELLRLVGLRRPHLPVILITAGGDIDPSKIRGANYRGTFRKPIDATALLEAIVAALKS